VGGGRRAAWREQAGQLLPLADGESHTPGVGLVEGPQLDHRVAQPAAPAGQPSDLGPFGTDAPDLRGRGPRRGIEDHGDLPLLFQHTDAAYPLLEPPAPAPAQAEGRRQVRWQGLLRKHGRSWSMERLGPSTLPHSGHPELLAAGDGRVLHIATTGVHWTDGPSGTWHPVEFPGLAQPYRSGYYPHSLRLDDGTILVFAHRGAHDPYGRDQSVFLDTFRLARNR
jgi:hypothetical protein